MLDFISGKRKSAHSTSSEDPERFYSQTLGVLVKLFKKHLPDTALDKSLENVREKRNCLVHHIPRKYQWPIMSDDDYVKAILEIEEIRELIENTDVEIA
jgi:hypothetical protein